MAEDPDKPPHVDANGTTTNVVPADGHTAPEPVVTKTQEPDADLDAQEMVIASLRTQVQDLFTQVTQLNSKLVNSYDRVSDLEDDLHTATATLKNSNVRISQLEMERTQHLAALNTGLLVEKSHVTTELNRLMEKATEEAAQRGQAESARAAIEKDLDDLSASLFAQANTMVAEARFARHLSEQKVVQAQQALKGAEEAVGIMQTQMQRMQSEKEEAEKKSQEMQAKMGKGKWLERIQSVDLSKPMKLMSSHLPYQEFLLFIAHLRSLHQTSQLPPAMTTILPLPFLARLASEDSEQTLRLDLAPSLNWLSRRAVQSAVHTGQLTIEPVSVSTLLSESSYSTSVTIAGLTNNSDTVPCALCGTSITTVAEYLQARLQRPNSLNQLNNSSWSGSFFKRQSSTTSNHGSVSPTQSITATGPISTSSSQSSTQQIHVFRVAPQQTTSISSSLPIPSSIAKSLSQGSTTATSPPHLSPMNGIAQSTSGSGNQPVTIYPLCTSGWCLRRLRSTCTMWAFVRTGIVERVWEEEMPSLPPPNSTAVAPSTSTASPSAPPIPPRKRGLWGFASAIGERAASWSDPDKKKQHTPSNSSASPVNGTPPPVPPRRDSGVGRRALPSAAETPPQQSVTQAVPPPIPLPESGTSIASPSSPVAPPVPRRSEGRKQSPSSPKAIEPQGRTNKEKDEAHSVPTTPTNKLLFDADSHQSPLKTAQPLPSVEDVVDPPPVVHTTPSPPAAEGKKNEEPEKVLLMKTNPNRFSLARSIPLPASRPGTPSQATDGALHPPSRTASPATVPVPNSTAPPPPVPRRAAARRAVPAPPSRPATPQKPQEEVKPAPEITAEKKAETGTDDKVTADTKEKVEVEVVEKKDATEGAVEATNNQDREEDLQKEKEDLSNDVEEVFEDAQSQLPTPAPVSEGDDQPHLITTASSASGSGDPIPDETPRPSPEKEKVEPIDTSTESTPDVFLDALSPPVAKPSLPASEPPSNLPNDRSVNGAAEVSPAPSPSANIQSMNGNEAVDGSGTFASSPVREKNEKEDEEEERVTDFNDKEVYIGEATWEERTWKELVRLREEMFWARIGGSR